MSPRIKNKIVDFFDKNSGNYEYVKSYLFPEKYYEDYAKILDCPIEYVKSYLFPEKYYEDYAKILDCSIELLMSVQELCDKPNLDKEKLLIEVANLENIKILT